MTITLFSCQTKKEKDMLDIELIKKHLKLQEKIELAEDDTDISHLYNLTDEDIELGGQVLQKGLINNGYKVPTDAEYQEKIKTIFNFKFNDEKNQNIIKHKNFETYLIPSNTDEDKKTLRQTEYDYTYNHIFFMKKYGLISELPLLGDIIEINKDGTYKINISQNIIARNKYLFNNSKGDLAWLLFNDKEFLKTLLITFGYNKDKELVKNIFKEFDFSNQNSVHNLLFSYNSENSKYLLRKGIMDDIENLVYGGKVEDFSYAKEGNGYNSISEIIQKIEDQKNNYTNPDETIAYLYDKTLQVGILGYIQEKLDNSPDYIEFLKKNNFFNFEKLKQYVEVIYQFPDEDEIEYDTSSHSTSYLLYDRPDFQSYAQEVIVKGDIEYLHQVSGWDFVKVNGITGYLATEELKKEQQEIEKKKYTFLADEDEVKNKKKKGFWDNLFG